MGKPGRHRAPSPVNPGDSATRQKVRHEEPPTRSRWGGYHLARPGGPRGRRSFSTRKNKPHPSNLKSCQRAAKTFGKNLEVVGFEPRTPSQADMLAYQGTVERSNAEGYRCINSVLVNVLTKGQGQAILLMEGTKLQELKEIENGTNRE